MSSGVDPNKEKEESHLGSPRISFRLADVDSTTR